MTTWNELVGFLATNYTCTINGNSVSLPYSFDDGRTQTVFVNQAGNETQGEWVHITSAVADVSHVGKLEAICRITASKLCGGVIIDGTFIVIRDTMPLENLDANEINSSMDLVVGIAEELEKMFIGTDNF